VVLLKAWQGKRTSELTVQMGSRGDHFEDKGVSAWASAFNLACSAIGAGVLSFPFAFEQTGAALPSSPLSQPFACSPSSRNPDTICSTFGESYPCISACAATLRVCRGCETTLN
jgi:Transmembrane amino acid transporter protein